MSISRVLFAVAALMTLLYANTASARVGEDVQQRAMCFIQKTAPELVYGQLPFSCDGKARLFEAEVTREAFFLEEREALQGIKTCRPRLMQPRNLLVVARTVWDVRDSPVLSSNAALAMGIQAACEAMAPAVKPDLPKGKPDFLHWTLDVKGYTPGKCTKSSLARSFADAKTWFKQNEGAHQLRALDEQEDKIIFAYYDGILRTDVIRTFYRSEAECRLYRP